MKQKIRTAVLMMLLAATVHPALAADAEESYGQAVGRKVSSGLANIATGVVEIPKNIINVSNQSNFAYGFVGGMLKGLLNTAGRISMGALDLVTAPIPSDPIVRPLYIWDDFSSDTSYGPALVKPKR